MPNTRSKDRIKLNAWLTKDAKRVLDALSASSMRSRTQVIELLILAEAERIAKSNDPNKPADLYSLIERARQEVDGEKEGG